MIDLKGKVTDETKKVAQAADNAAFKNMRHAAASIRKDALASIIVSKEVIGYIYTTNKNGDRVKVKVFRPSPAGTPPYSHRNKMFFQRGLQFVADNESATIGPTKSAFGESLAVHEFGEEYKGIDYDERPFMNPALERNVPRFADSWSGSIGQ